MMMVASEEVKRRIKLGGIKKSSDLMSNSCFLHLEDKVNSIAFTLGNIHLSLALPLNFST